MVNTINYNHYIGRVFKDVDCVYDCDYNYETTIYFIYDTYIKNEPMFRYEVMYVQHDVIDIPSYEDGKYYKHSVGLPEVALWDVQDISGAYVDKYKYQVNFLPEMIVPVEIVSND